MMEGAVVGRTTTSLGRHIIAEVFTNDAGLLNDENYLKKAMIAAANSAKMTILDVGMHKFSPQGVTGYLLLAESHISIHTWPEYGYAAMDIFTCGGNPEEALREMEKHLKAHRIEVQQLDRGAL